MRTHCSANAFALPRLDRCADHIDSVAAEDLVESVIELAVAIMDQYRNRCSPPSCMRKLRACRAVQRPSRFELQARYSIRRVATEMKKSRKTVSQEDRVNCQEVAGGRARGLRPQERSPRGTRPLR